MIVVYYDVRGRLMCHDAPDGGVILANGTDTYIVADVFGGKHTYRNVGDAYMALRKLYDDVKAEQAEQAGRG